MSYLKLLTTSLILSLLASQSSSQVLLSDNFNDNKINPALWKVVLKGVPKRPAVREQNQRMELQGRGHLVTVAQFDPNKTAYVLTGTWTYASMPQDFDKMQILLRSDGVPSGPYGETANGIEIGLDVFRSPKLSTLSINVRGSLLSISAYSPRQLLVRRGGTYAFTIIHAGGTVTASMQDVVSKVTVTTTVTVISDRTKLKYITFHNREGPSIAHLDDVVISRFPPASLSSFGSSCMSSSKQVPIFGAVGPPVLGKQFTMTMRKAAPGKVGIIPVGSGQGQLKLAFLGAPGCTYLLKPGTELLYLAAVTAASGRWFNRPGILMPLDRRLAGATFFTQTLFLDSKANFLGITTTNALKGTLGY